MNFDEFRAASQRARVREEDKKAATTRNAAGTTSKSAVASSDAMDAELLRQRNRGIQKETSTDGSGGIASQPTATTTSPRSTQQSGTNNNGGPTKNKQSTTSKSSFGFGDFLEMLQMQALICGMIVLDTFFSLGELYLLKEKYYCKWTLSSSPSKTADITLTLLQSFTSFTVIFFAIELLTVVLVFRKSVFGHVGYLLDILIVSSQLYLELVMEFGKETRVLNVFRLWRSVRLFNAVVNIEKELHEKTKGALVAKDAELRKVKLSVQSLETNVLKEKEAKGAIEEMLLTYKEEVDTLNEALKIAAMDIAEVAQADDSDFDSEEGTISGPDEDDEDVSGGGSGSSSSGGGDKRRRMAGRSSELDDQDEADFVDASTSVFDGDKKRNRETLIKLVRRDAGGSSGGGGGGVASSASGSYSSRAPTFVIHEDGSFEQKK